MKLFRVKYELSLDGLVFTDEALVPATTVAEARQYFLHTMSTAFWLFVHHKDDRVLFPLQHAKSKVNISSVRMEPDSKRHK